MTPRGTNFSSARHRAATFVFGILFFVAMPGHGADAAPRGPVAETWEEAFARLHPLNSSRASTESPPEFEGMVVAGYQGWFGAEGDSSGLGWKHYGPRNLGPGNCTFDLWPDMTELDEEERYPSPFQRADGSVAALFSSYNSGTIDRHFEWMATYGIDGAMLQRFGVSLKSPREYDFGTGVLQNVRQAADRHGRAWAVMYDLSGLRKGEVVPVLTADWKRLVDRAKILADRGYLHHETRPLVAIWGIGFSDGRAYGLEECTALVDFFKNDPEYGGNAVMLGIPYYWRSGDRDAIADPSFHALLERADILSPWAVGRYGSEEEAGAVMPAQLAEDLRWTQARGLGYIPVIFPGFSWQNLRRFHGDDAPLNQIPREKGKFLWRQAREAIRGGSKSLYIAMFDEVDEATAIFKASNHPPIGESDFITYEGLPSDHYLWLSGQIGKALRGEIPIEATPPSRVRP